MVSLMNSFKKHNFGKWIHLENQKVISGKWVPSELMFDEPSCFMPLCPAEEGQVHLRYSLDTVPFLSLYLEKASDWLIWST